jgi:hypothetical protein
MLKSIYYTEDSLSKCPRLMMTQRLVTTGVMIMLCPRPAIDVLPEVLFCSEELVAAGEDFVRRLLEVVLQMFDMLIRTYVYLSYQYREGGATGEGTYLRCSIHNEDRGGISA